MEIRLLPLLFLTLVHALPVQAQTAFTGDQFGGRLWYKPTNYSVGSYSAHTICGENNQLYSWGTNSHGELGIPGIRSLYLPEPVPGMDQVYYYSAGYMSGAVKFDQSGWVWGNYFATPTRVIEDVKYVDAGQNAVTFIKSDGTVWSVGLALPGCFGTGQSIVYLSKTPVQMKNVKDAVRVANGKYVTLILLKDGTVMTCGYNKSNGLSMFGDSVVKVPRIIPGLKDIVAIAAARDMNFALDKDGNVYQWGAWYNTPVSLSKVPGLRNIVAISSRNDGAHAMALDANGLCYAWGENYYHQQLGNGTKENTYEPSIVATDVIDILAGESFSYIIKSDFSLWACGSSNGGSIYLDRQNIKRDHYVRLNPLHPTVNLCKPVINDFRNHTKLEVRLCRDTFFEYSGIKYYSDVTLFDTFTNSYGFDSTLEIEVKFNIFVKRIIERTICEGDYLDMFNRIFLRGGTYYDSTITKAGCDSITELRLKVNKRSAYYQEKSLCLSNEVRVGNHIYTEPGAYMDSFKNALGCDSLVITKIYPPHTDSSFVNISMCEGDILYRNNYTYYTAGSYTEYLSNRFRCDSIVFIALEIRDRSVTVQDVKLCPGTSFSVAGNEYFTAGEYRDTLVNSLFCDSVIISRIEEVPVNETFQNALICKGDTLFALDTFYIDSGYYSNTYTSILHCDSTVYLHVTYLPIYDCWGGNIFIPNAFTPNADPFNNSFTFVAQNFNSATLQIFNRWGQLIYEETSDHPSWDGTYLGEMCQNGVYLYKLDVEFEELGHKKYAGTVCLIR